MSKMDKWPELEKRAGGAGLLSANVLSEMVFNAAAGVVNDRCICICTGNGDCLNFIKMNHASIVDAFYIHLAISACSRVSLSETEYILT